MVAARPADANDLQHTPGLPSGSPQRLQEVRLADQTGARTGQENAARRHRLQGQLVHVEITLQRQIDLLPIPRLLGRVEDHHVEPLPRGDHLAEPRKQISLHEPHLGLIEIGILLRQRDRLFVDVDADDFVRPAERLRVNGKPAAVADDFVVDCVIRPTTDVRLSGSAARAPIDPMLHFLGSLP